MKELEIARMKATAAKFSAVRLAFHLYSFYDMMIDREVSEKQKQILCSSTAHLSELMKSGQTKADLMNLRETVRMELEQILKFTEYFKIYDHILEVQKAQFDSNFKATGKTDDQVIAMVMAFLKNSNDMISFNTKVQDIVGLLPLRLTKQKFFSMLEESFGIYKGGAVSTFQDFIDLILSAVEYPEKSVIEFQGIEETFERLRGLDLKSLTKEDCDYHRGTIKISDQVLSEATDIYVAVAEIINDIYVLSLSDSMMELSEDPLLKPAFSIFEHVIEQMNSEELVSIEDQVLESLRMLENKQEEYFEQYQSLAPEQEEDEKLVKINHLLSSSVFAKLDTNVDASVLDQAAFRKITETFFEKLKGTWSDLQKPVMRLQMAHILSAVPANYGSYQELQEFISHSIAGCSDFYEKELCKKNLIELLR